MSYKNLKVTLHHVTIKQCTDVEEQIKIASKAGYQGIDFGYLDVAKYLKNGNSIKKLVDMLDKNNLVVSHFDCLAGWQFNDGLPLVCELENKTGKKKEDIIREAEEFLKVCSELRCQYVLTVSAIEESGSINSAANDLARVNELINKYGRLVAFEYVGFAKQINNLSIAMEIIRKTGCQNIGVLLDTFHFYVGGSTINDLEKLPLEDIALVHINDSKDKPRNVLTDLDRIFPGDGIIPLEQILAVLKNKGYSGYLSVEIFNEEYWKNDPLKIAIEAREKTERILSRI